MIEWIEGEFNIEEIDLEDINDVADFLI